MNKTSCLRMAFSILTLVGLSACSPDEEAAPAAPPVQTILLEKPGQTPFRRFPGEVAAVDTSEMSFEVSGRLIEFPATQGVEYKKGDLLGRLDETNFVARVDAANADFTKARNELDRQTQLHRRGVISQSELDRFQRAFGVAEAAQREAQRALDDTRMLAPFDGRVARTLVNNFQNVQARQPVLIFQNNASLEVDIQIPESDMSLGSQGLTAENARDRIEARVEFPAIPGQSFDLELKSFGTEASRSARTFPVTFNLTPPAGQNILPGMTCTVLVRLKTQGPDQPAAEGLFQVPIRAVATVDGTSSVWKLDTTTMKVSKIPVEMGAVTGETVSVKTSSLRPGDEIVISGVRFLSEGMVVQRFQN